MQNDAACPKAIVSLLAGLVGLEQPQQQQQGLPRLDLLVAAAWEAQLSEKDAAEDSDTTASDDSEEDEGMGVEYEEEEDLSDDNAEEKELSGDSDEDGCPIGSSDRVSIFVK